MKKNLPYIAGALALIVLIVLVIFAPIRLSKSFDERVTLRQKDKIPYGTYVAYNLLPQLFPHAEMAKHDQPPTSWAGDSVLPTGQAVFLVARYFDPSKEELRYINRFVNNGNHVFIITNSFTYDAGEHFGISAIEYLASTFFEDTLQVSLRKPLFDPKKKYEYPGKKFTGFFTEVNPTRAFILGSDEDGHPNFVQLKSGKGRLYIHLAPLAFTNYFILHKQNVAYFENVVSLIPKDVNKVTWNQYYLLERRKNSGGEPNVLKVLWQYPSFKWALIAALVTLLLYTLVEMRRRQRMIPPIKSPVNDSLDFVKTLGRLYYDKGDHHNLAKKMATYFLDEVRTRYFIPTQKMDAEFVKELHQKSGHDVERLQEIVLFINRLELNNHVAEVELAHFYHQLETFYQNT